MTTQEKLQHLFEAALQSSEQPLPKQPAATPDVLFAPPPWRAKEAGGSTQPQPKPKEET